MSKVAVAGSWLPVTSASTGIRVDASMSNSERSVGEQGVNARYESDKNGHSEGGSKSNSAFLDYLSSDGAVREKEIELQRGKGIVNKGERTEKERIYRQNVPATSSSVPLGSQGKYPSSSSHVDSFPPEPPSRVYNQSPHGIPYNHQYEQQQYEQQQYNPHKKNGGATVDVSELEDSFNSMLMAWYHSGYATGRYQTLVELSKKETMRDNSELPQYRHNMTAPPYPATREDRTGKQETHTNIVFERYSDEQNEGYPVRGDNTDANRDVGLNDYENSRQT
jgi:hypothetical protein